MYPLDALGDMSSNSGTAGGSVALVGVALRYTFSAAMVSKAFLVTYGLTGTTAGAPIVNVAGPQFTGGHQLTFVTVCKNTGPPTLFTSDWTDSGFGDQTSQWLTCQVVLLPTAFTAWIEVSIPSSGYDEAYASYFSVVEVDPSFVS